MDKKGIIFIQALRYEMGMWLEYNAFKDKYNIQCSFMQYQSLISAIVGHINKLRKGGIHVRIDRPQNCIENSTIYQTTLDYKINLKSAKARDFYTLFMMPKVSYCLKWLEIGVSEETYLKSMIWARESTKEPRLLSLHYKVINNVWPTGEKLYRWKIKPHDRCYVCGKTDTIVQALCECINTTDFLLQTQQRLKPCR